VHRSPGCDVVGAATQRVITRYHGLRAHPMRPSIPGSRPLTWATHSDRISNRLTRARVAAYHHAMRLMLVTAVLAAALGLAAPAHADNASYLAALAGTGLHDQKPDGLLTVGHYVCGALEPSPGLMFGLAPNKVADIVWQNNPELERDQATQVVNAAIDNLCPVATPFGHAS
jgi:hypothetical protein